MTALLKTTAAFSLAVVLATTAAIAQDNQSGRYSMHKSNDGFVRLDTLTGDVSFCRKSERGWRCTDMQGSDADRETRLSDRSDRSDDADRNTDRSDRSDDADRNTDRSNRSEDADRNDDGDRAAGSKGLAEQNAELKAEIRRLEELLELRGERRNEGPKQGFKLPTEREVDQALDYFERMLKKFQDRLKRLEEGAPKPERQL